MAGRPPPDSRKSARAAVDVTIWKTSLVALGLIAVAGCQSKSPVQPQAGFPACVALLHDRTLAGMRLVEASTYGSGLVQCFYAPANVHAADASAAKPIRGKRAVLPESGGTPQFSEVSFRQPPVDPGDEGPVAGP